MIVFPNCKINLGLHILRKRTDGFHDLDTVFYPVGLQDALEAVQNTESREADIRVTGLPIEGKPEDNICIKAFELLKKDFPHLPPIHIHLHKSIPAGAGLGGGSADGAFTLLLLNRKFNLNLKDDQLIRYALLLGSDCPFFIKNKPCLATGRGEMMVELNLDLSAYKIILVHPRIHISTGWAFSQLHPDDSRPSIKEIMEHPVQEWKALLINDFEAPIFSRYEEIKEIKNVLYQLGALYASLSGSGSTVYGIFPKNQPLTAFPFPPHYLVKEC